MRMLISLGLLVGLVGCSAEPASPPPQPSMTTYETPDEISALYVIGDQYAFHPAMVDDGTLIEWMIEVVQPIPIDKYGCRVMGSSFIPTDLKAPKCEGVTFSIKQEGELTVLENSCWEDSRFCHLQWYNKRGELVAFQLLPDDPNSRPYNHISGPILSIEGFSRD